MSKGVQYPNLTNKFQKEVSQMADHKLSHATAIGVLSVNLNHLIKSGRESEKDQRIK